MNQDQRHQRLRLLVKKLNKERKRQASKVDILCNDLVGAQRGFVKRLNDVSFAAHFYKSLLGISNLSTLLSRAGQLMVDQVPGAGITFFVRGSDGFQRHSYEGNAPIQIDDQPLEDYFERELADNICKSNRSCTADDMFSMGFHGNPQSLSGISMATLPLKDLGRALGFVLLYRPITQPLTAQELFTVGLVTCGLSHAVAACPSPAHLGK